MEAGQLLPMVYQELRSLAAQKMGREGQNHTLQPTALVHEAWLRLAARDGEVQFQNRAHFFSAAAEAMRRILVDHARNRRYAKRGGSLVHVSLDDALLGTRARSVDILALDEALTRLAETNPEAAELVKLCFFVGLTHEHAAQEFGVSVSTIERTWTFARAWLFHEIRQDLNTAPDMSENAH